MTQPRARRVHAWTARIQHSLIRAWPDGLGLALLIAIAVFESRAYHGVVIDDSFITFRHASNLLHGNGFSCDPTQPVEGTSSPLFAWLAVLPIALGLEPYGFATWLSTSAFAGCVIVAYLTVRACLDGPPARVLGLGAAALVATSPILAFHSQTGLETLLYSLIISAALWQLLQALSRDHRSASWAVLMGVAALTRPEGLGLFGLLLLIVGFVRRGIPNNGRMLARELRAFALVWTPWLLFRLLYFGRWLPNSVLSKSGYHMGLQHPAVYGFLERLVHGEGSTLVLQFAIDHGVQAGLLLGAVVFRKVRLPIFIGIALTLTYGGLTTWSGGDWMPNYRLLVACVSPLAVGAAVGLRGFLFHEEQRGVRHVPSVVVALFVFGASIALQPKLSAKLPVIKDLPQLREVGLRLSRVTRRDDVVVSAMAGIIPYYWGARTIDMFGLCDPHLSSRGQPMPLGIGRFDPPTLIAKHPTFYVFEFPQFAADFVQLPEFAPYRNDYLMLEYPFGYLDSKTFSPPVLLVRKDRPELDRLTQALGVKLVEVEREFRRTGFIR